MSDTEEDTPFDQFPTFEWAAFRVGANDDHEESSFALGDEGDIHARYRDFFLV